MARIHLGRLFGSTGPGFDIEADPRALGKRVDAGVFGQDVATLAEGGRFDVLGRALAFELDAAATVHTGEVSIASPFGGGAVWQAPGGRRFAGVEIRAACRAAGPGVSLGAAFANLAFQLNATSSLAYRRTLAVPEDQKRRDALAAVLAGSRPPLAVAFDALSEAEAQETEGLISIGLGADASAGRGFTLSRDLFEGLAPALRIHAQYAIHASLSASLYGRVKWTVGRGPFTTHAGWVRVRAERERRRTLGFGTFFALDVEYDLGRVLEALLARVLELDPVVRLREALGELAAFAADPGARLGDLAEQTLKDALGPLFDRAQAPRAVDAAAALVRAYDALDERVAGFWGGLLNRRDVAAVQRSLRAALARIAALKDPKELLEDANGELVTLVEALTGASLEEIWLASDASARLQAIRNAAEKALAFLDEFERLDATVNQRLTTYLERSGIAGTIDWLRENATSVPALRAAVTARLSGVVEKLVGKAFDRIDDADIERLRAWAVRLDAYLAGGELEQELIAKLKTLDGQVGFKLGVEVERVSRSAALIDIEFDRKNGAARDAAAALLAGRFDAALRLLSSAGDDAGSKGFLLHECVFTSERLRTSSWSFLSRLFGDSAHTRQRASETRLEVAPDDASSTRRGRYAGTFTRTVRRPQEKAGLATSHDFSASAGWCATASGPGLDTSAPFDRVEHRVALTIAREDDVTTGAELRGIRTLLLDLGFLAEPDPAALDRPSRLAIALEIGDDAFAGFVAGTIDAGWNGDFLAAAQRWFDEPLVAEEAKELAGDPVARGTVLAALMRTPAFADHWDTRGFATGGALAEIRVDLDDGTFRSIRLAPRAGEWSGNYHAVRSLVDFRTQAAKSLGRVAKAAGARTHAELSGLADTTSWLFLQVSPSHWNAPTFAVWFALARLARLAPLSLERARGLASFRFRQGGSVGAWSAPQRWTLRPGLLQERLQRIFRR